VRGKLAIVAMLFLAVAMAGFGWYWNYQRSFHTRIFWDTDRALTIRYPQQVSAAWIVEGESLNYKEITKAPGILNAIDSLTKDSNYNWENKVDSQPFRGQAAVRFTRDSVAVTAVFDFDLTAIHCEENGKYVSLHPKTCKGWKQYLDQHLNGKRTVKTLP
jgi:hypothetical protein